MKIALLQTDIEWSDTSSNIRQANALLTSSEPADLYVLPEMWNTGFLVNKADILPYMKCGGPATAISWMKQTANRFNAALCGSLSLSDGSNQVNRFLFVTPEGNTYHYDKRHLFTMGHEDESYTCGRQRVVVCFHGVRFLLATCYDLRFPVWLRNQNDYDVLLLVANWPQSRQHVWETLIRARAIENQCYVVGVNRIGSDPVCQYVGGSCVIDARGHQIVSATTADQPSIVSVELDLNELESFRQIFPVLADADSFTLLERGRLAPTINCEINT